MVAGKQDALLAQMRKGTLQYCVLALLADEERYGFDLVRSLAETDGMVTSEGTIYPLLSRLRRDGLVETTWRESTSGPPRRYYQADGRRTGRARRVQGRVGALSRRRGSLRRKEGWVMSTTPDKLVERYLKHLEVELDDVPRDRRREIVDEIAGHIAEARAGLEHETEADVRNILDGLGDPADIAADARERFEVRAARSGSAAYKPGWIEVGALVLLLVGGIVMPVLRLADRRRPALGLERLERQGQVIGTLFVPGGLGLLALPLFLCRLQLDGVAAHRRDCEVDPATGQEFNCV